MEKILKLHDYSKEAFVKEATQFVEGKGTVIRKLEVAMEIAKEIGIRCVKIAAKNTMVYAAVESVDADTGERQVKCRIYDTSVFNRSGKTYISWKMYDEADYMPIDEYERYKERLNDYGEGTKEYERLMNKLNIEKRYVLPTTCHSSVLKKLTPTAKTNVNRWRMDCKDILAGLAAEKLYEDSLTNLPIMAKIKLAEIRSDGTPIYLVKDTEGSYKYPVWIDDTTGQKYKINQIQQIGFEIVERE